MNERENTFIERTGEGEGSSEKGLNADLNRGKIPALYRQQVKTSAESRK